MRHLVLPALLLVAAPAHADPAEFTALQSYDQRLATVGNRLATGAADLCADARPLPGFAVHALAQYSPATRADVRAAFGIDDRPAILAVVPTSAAARAGLMAGDAIVTVDGEGVAPFTPGKRGDYAEVGALEQRIEGALAHPPLVLGIDRKGQRLDISFTPEKGCPTRFQVLTSEEMNAGADGAYVQVSVRIMDFAENDDELALLVAHELAHNILHHRERLDAQHVSRGLLSAFGKNRTRIRATEQQADRLAIWLVARAGYDIDAAPAFWDRLGRKTGFGIFSDGTHDGRAERVAGAREEIAAIKALEAAGKPLDPPKALRAPPQ